MNAIRSRVPRLPRNSIVPHNVRERPSDSQPNTFAQPLTYPYFGNRSPRFILDELFFTGRKTQNEGDTA